MKNRLSYLLLMIAGLGLSQASLARPLDNQPRPDLTCEELEAAAPRSTASSSGEIGSLNVECRDARRVNVVYTLTVPPSCVQGGCGLIFDIHGASMNADQQDAGTKLRQYGWNAMQYGATTPFIVVQPSLTDLFDSETRLDPASVFTFRLVYKNELPNILNFVETITQKYSVNTNRTHIYGFSRGGATVAAIYCDPANKDKFASYAIGGYGIRCDLDKPLMIIHGDKDLIYPRAIDKAEEQIKDIGNVTETAVVDNPRYSRPEYVQSPTGRGIERQGQHHHLRFETGNYLLETIRHSGLTLPLLGHCNPTETSKNGWFVCFANMETGRKLVDFFIQNPN